MSKRICYNAITKEVLVVTGGKAAFNRCTYAMINYFYFCNQMEKVSRKAQIIFSKSKLQSIFDR